MPPLHPASTRYRPPPDMPQFERNKLLNARVQELEDELASAVASANEQAEFNLSRFSDFVESKEALANLSGSLSVAKEATVETYVSEIAISNDLQARLKLEKELKWKNYEAYHPEWLKYLTKVGTTIDKYGYSNHTKWRSAINNLLRHASRAFAQRNGHQQAVTGDFRRMCVAFNAYGRDELREEIEKLEDRAGDVEGMNDPTFQLLRLEFRMARDAYNRAASAKMYRNDRVVMENQKKQSIRDAATRHRSELGLGQNHQITMSATGSKRVDHRKLAKMEASEKTKEGLMLALRLPVTRDNENEMEGLYNTLLAHCATSGDWFGAVQAYEDYCKRGFVPNKFVYGCVISACKRADPPQVDRAVLVLDEMIASDVPVTVATYNAVLDCCRVGGSWRRGVQIFESMTTGGPTQAGVKPNTNTYSIMAKLGYEAKNDDPGEIYTALKYAGVPEYIAYSSAASNALKVDKTRGVKGGGRSLEEELDLLEFIEVPVVKRRDGDTAGAVARVQEQARDIEKAVDRILKVGGKGLLDGEDDRTVSTVTASVRYREEDVGAEVRTVESNKTVI
ncbi:hypothetical protein TeGR_g11284 [Tetraparma gracilis]|uniref:Pentatricopeptide repeat-containing protein n=1 Tax=Tetraparma gracilis TaxID=2962635 RepID=A0ABQ6N4U8_9STRA|nr:hypothetical protein TeGR_g11284 [Tetraparma gracilis]